MSLILCNATHDDQMPSFVSRRKMKSNHDQALINSDLLEVLVGSLLLDLDKVIVIIVILGLGNLSFPLPLVAGVLGFLEGVGTSSSSEPLSLAGSTTGGGRL